jgi:hypothetical protein
MAAFLRNQASPRALRKARFGDVAPIHDRASELLVARVDFFGERVARADLGDDILADREHGFQQGIVEFQDFDGTFLTQLA